MNNQIYVLLQSQVVMNDIRVAAIKSHYQIRGKVIQNELQSSTG